MTTIRAFFPSKLGNFFPIFEKGQGIPPPIPPFSYVHVFYYFWVFGSADSRETSFTISTEYFFRICFPHETWIKFISRLYFYVSKVNDKCLWWIFNLLSEAKKLSHVQPCNYYARLVRFCCTQASGLQLH